MLDDAVRVLDQAEHRRIQKVAVHGVEHAVALHLLVAFQLQPRRVRFSLVAQRAVLGADDQRARLPRQVGVEQRREVGVVEIGGRRAVQVHVALDVAPGEQVVLAVLAHRVEPRRERVVVVIRDGVQQHLRARLEVAAVARHERQHCRQVAARAVAEQHHVLGVDILQQRARVQLARHLVAVLGRLGEAVFGCTPVVDRHHAPLQLYGHGGARVDVEVNRAVHPAAAVEEQDGAARVLGYLQPLGQREIEVKRREHAQRHLEAVGHRGESLVDAAAGVGQHELGADVLGEALRFVELPDVGPKPCCRLERGKNRLVDGHACRPFSEPHRSISEPCRAGRYARLIQVSGRCFYLVERRFTPGRSPW